jgi:uncharacterized protein YndB with AHSA1/START domain
MSVVDTSVVIAAPPQVVWDTVMDQDRLAEWVTIHRKVSGGGAPAKGLRMEQTLHLRGVNFKVKWLLVECETARRAVWEGRGPAHSRAHIEYEFEPTGDGTRMHYRNEFIAPLGPLGAAASRALVGGIPKREADHSLARLKALLENTPGG